MPAFQIISPDSSLITSPSVTLKFSLPSNFRLTDFRQVTKNAFNQGHIHLWIDQSNPTPQSAIKIFSDAYALENLSPGSHSVTAELVTNTHTSLIPKTTSSLSFTLAAPTPTPRPSFLSFPSFQIVIVSFILIVTSLYFLSLHRPHSKPRR